MARAQEEPSAAAGAAAAPKGGHVDDLVKLEELTEASPHGRSTSPRPLARRADTPAERPIPPPVRAARCR